MLMEGRLPAGINNLRLGESFVLSNDTSTGLPKMCIRDRLKTMLDLPVPRAIMGDFRDYLEEN